MRLLLLAGCAIQIWGAPTTVMPEIGNTTESAVHDTTTSVITNKTSDVDQKTFPFNSQGFILPYGAGGFLGGQNPFGDAFGSNPYGYSLFQTPPQNNPYGRFPVDILNRYPNEGPFQQYPGTIQFNPASQGNFPVSQATGQPVQPAEVLGHPESTISIAGTQSGAPTGENGQPLQPGQIPQGNPGYLGPPRVPGPGNENQLHPGVSGIPGLIPQDAQGQLSQGAQGQFPQDAEGQFLEGTQGHLPQGVQGQLSANGQNRFTQNPQGLQTGYIGNPGFPQVPSPQKPFGQASTDHPGNPIHKPNAPTPPTLSGSSGSDSTSGLEAVGGQDYPRPQEQGVTGQNPNSQFPPSQLLPSGQSLPGQGPQGDFTNQGLHGVYNGQASLQGQPQGQGHIPEQFRGPQKGQSYPGQFSQDFYNQQPYPQKFVPQQQYPRGFVPQQQGFPQGQGPLQQFPQGQGYLQQFPQGQGSQPQFLQEQKPQQQVNPGTGLQPNQQPPRNPHGQIPNPGTDLNGPFPLRTNQEHSPGLPSGFSASPVQSRTAVPASPGTFTSVYTLNNNISVSSPGPPSPEEVTSADQPLPQVNQGSELRSEARAMHISELKRAEKNDVPS
ncbi:collagen alpha-1(V) chain-like isoform X1 [Varroa destructor]|uniref:Uncharacterized protein n=1 Tax=Varroa destructor TaxID=109461 RepID=A0A7M7KIW3_VARDE|nr:collagen alpha-1(V) chain-like isoform X1 [Varroa destructor]